MFNYGEFGQHCYIILKGSVEVLIPEFVHPPVENPRALLHFLISNFDRLYWPSLPVPDKIRHWILKKPFTGATWPERADEIDALCRKKLTSLHLKVFKLIKPNQDFSVQIFKPQNLLRVGDQFGELALLHSKPRLATIRCETDSVFAVLSRDSYDRTIGTQQRRYLKRMIEQFRNFKILSRLQGHEIQRVHYMMQKREFSYGQHLMIQS